MENAIKGVEEGYTALGHLNPYLDEPRTERYRDGNAADYSEKEASEILSCPEVTAYVDMKMGSEEATAWGCDLTYDYVKINADYRS